MENNQNPDQNLDQLMSDTQQSSSSPQTTRTYECNFCKRGFTNAQALGGHMNIHRKDKAKLKQPPFTIHHKTKPPQAPPQQSSEIANLPIMSLEESDKFNVTRDSDDHGVKWPNNLFLDDQEKDHKHDDDDHERACSAGLDLELRLGPEPHQGSSSSTSVATRKFF